MTDANAYLLTIPEVADRLSVNNQEVRDWVSSNVLRVTAGDGNRGIDAESVEALAAALALPEGPERDDAVFSLRERNASSQGNPTV